MPLSPGKCQSQLQLTQKETIFFSGYGTNIPTPNAQFPNNIKIRNTNFLNNKALNA
jgi:hypothetical protein